jgi:sulfite oxidase
VSGADEGFVPGPDAVGRVVYDAAGLNVGAIVPAEAGITPVGHFFTRSHAPPPAIDTATYRLEVDGLVERPLSLSLEALATAFVPVDEVATLVCAGLRRVEFAALGSLNGELPWGADPVSTGRWGGVRLGDVLRAAGVQAAATHVAFTGLDQVARDGAVFGFGGSIGIARALEGPAMLAWSLNGAPLPAAHGAPLRALVPGAIGARSVKWLGRITVTDRESDNYFQQRAYRMLREPVPGAPRDVRTGTAMEAIPRNAVIVAPSAGAAVPAGALMVRGWVIGEGCAPVRMVEVRVDEGPWRSAIVEVPAGAWAWSAWRCGVEVDAGAHRIMVRMADALGENAASLEPVWNVKGYGNNAWSMVEVVATG